MEASEETTEVERSPAETAELIEAGAQLIDVRQDYEYEAARLAGASRIGLEILAEDRSRIERARPVVFYCRTGSRSEMAAQAFAAAGFEATSMAGGIVAWIEDGREIEPADGYVSQPGEAAAILEARARGTS